MEKNCYLYGLGNNKRIVDNALEAIAATITESKPTGKETMVKLIVNLINSWK